MFEAIAGNPAGDHAGGRLQRPPRRWSIDPQGAQGLALVVLHISGLVLVDWVGWGIMAQLSMNAGRRSESKE